MDPNIQTVKLNVMTKGLLLILLGWIQLRKSDNIISRHFRDELIQNLMTILVQLKNDRRSTELHVDFTPVACILLDENVNPITFIYFNAPKEKNITERKSNFTSFLHNDSTSGPFPH